MILMRTRELSGCVWVWLRSFTKVLICWFHAVFLPCINVSCSWPYYINGYMKYKCIKVKFYFAVFVCTFRYVKKFGRRSSVYEVVWGNEIIYLSLSASVNSSIMAYNAANAGHKELLIDNLNKYSFLVSETETVFVVADMEFKTVRISEANIVDLLNALELLNGLIELSPLEFPAYKFIRFEKAGDKDKFVSLFKQFENNTVYMADMLKNEQIVKFSVTWLPLLLIEEELPKIMDSYGEIIASKPTVRKINEINSYLTTPVYITFRLKQGVSINDLPYCIKAKGNCKGWLHYPFRKQVCYRCQSVSHSIKLCNVRWCRSCKGFCALQHVCVNSYSNIVRGAKVTNGVVEAENKKSEEMKKDGKYMTEQGNTEQNNVAKVELCPNQDTVVKDSLNANMPQDSTGKDLLEKAILESKLNLEMEKFRDKMDGVANIAGIENRAKKQKLLFNNGSNN